MRWRLFRLNWSYGLGELFIIIAGVLIALSVEQWNSDRLDLVQEVLIIERLISDLEDDLRGIELGLSFLPRKEESLQRDFSVLTSTGPEPEDIAGFLGDVIYGAQYGWNQEIARRTTIDELLSSGRFGLIRNSEVRTKISDYYSSDRGANNRIEERETQYPDISYQLVTRVNEFELDPGLSRPQLERLAAGVFDSSLLNHVIAEINFTRFVRQMFIALQTECDDLVTELQSYMETLQ